MLFLLLYYKIFCISVCLQSLYFYCFQASAVCGCFIWWKTKTFVLKFQKLNNFDQLKKIITFFFFFTKDCLELFFRVQRGLLVIWQRWRRDHHDQRTRNCHAQSGSKSDGSRATGYDKRSGRWWWVLSFSLFLWLLSNEKSFSKWVWKWGSLACSHI